MAATISRLPWLRALTKDGFTWVTMEWFFKNTGVPLSFAIVVAMGLFIGLSVTGLTFLIFVQDNLKDLAALQAMGAGLVVRNHAAVRVWTECLHALRPSADSIRFGATGHIGPTGAGGLGDLR